MNRPKNKETGAVNRGVSHKMYIKKIKGFEFGLQNLVQSYIQHLSINKKIS